MHELCQSNGPSKTIRIDFKGEKIAIFFRKDSVTNGKLKSYFEMQNHQIRSTTYDYFWSWRIKTCLKDGKNSEDVAVRNTASMRWSEVFESACFLAVLSQIRGHKNLDYLYTFLIHSKRIFG